MNGTGGQGKRLKARAPERQGRGMEDKLKEKLLKQIKEENLLAKNNLFLVKVNLAIQIALLVILSYTLWRLLQQ